MRPSMLGGKARLLPLPALIRGGFTSCESLLHKICEHRRGCGCSLKIALRHLLDRVAQNPDQ